MAVLTDDTAAPARRAGRRSGSPTASRPPGSVGRRRGSSLPVILVLPAVILLLLFTFLPAIYALVLSFLQLKIGGGLLGQGTATEVFAGLSNYTATLGDPEFWRSIGRMLIIAGVGVPGTILLATLFALCLDAKRTRLVGLTRLAIFLPYAVPGVVASLLWGFLYLPATSPIGGKFIDYLGHGVFFGVANVAVWGVVGFNMIILYTAVRGLSPELYEAAQLDGASELQIALRIKLPLIRPAIVMCTLFSVLGALQLFNEPTTLKPLTNAISSTWVPLMGVYTNAFVNNNIYQGAASAFVLIVMTVAATVLVNRVGSRFQKDQ